MKQNLNKNINLEALLEGMVFWPSYRKYQHYSESQRPYPLDHGVVLLISVMMLVCRGPFALGIYKSY